MRQLVKIVIHPPRCCWRLGRLRLRPSVAFEPFPGRQISGPDGQGSDIGDDVGDASIVMMILMIVMAMVMLIIIATMER